VGIKPRDRAEGQGWMVSADSTVVRARQHAAGARRALPAELARGADRSPRSTPQTCSPPRRPAGLTRKRSPGRTSPAGAGPWFCRGQRRRLPGAGLRGAPARPGAPQVREGL